MSAQQTNYKMVPARQSLFQEPLTFTMILSGINFSNKAFVISTFVLASIAAVAQPRGPRPAPIRIKGSYVIAAICKDGIIVASDSRGTLKDTHGRRIAYYDVNQKIFPLGDKLIADTGYASLDDPKTSFLAALMSEFAKDPLSHVDVEQLPNAYFKYANTVLPPAGAGSARIQTLIFAGFSNNKPVMCIYYGEGGRGTSCRYSGYLSSPNQGIPGLAQVGSLTFREAASVMQQTIRNYAAAVQPGSVGGPVVIRIIKTASPSEWLETPPQWPDWQAFTDLAEDYKAGRVMFNLMPGITKNELDSLIEDGANWARLAEVSNQPKSANPAPVIGSYPER